MRNKLGGDYVRSLLVQKDENLDTVIKAQNLLLFIVRESIHRKEHVGD